MSWKFTYTFYDSVEYEYEYENEYEWFIDAANIRFVLSQNHSLKASLFAANHSKQLKGARRNDCN